MDKKIFQKGSAYNLLQAIFGISFVFFVIIGMWAFYENNMPLVVFFWAAFVVILYWLIKIGKIKTGISRGFVFGLLIDFTLLFTLHKINPEEDIAGIVIISLLLSGLFFAFIGHLIQNYFWKKNGKYPIL